VKVSIKFPWGKQVVRRFHKSDQVRTIYSFAQKTGLDAEGRKEGDKLFDLFTVYPSMSLMNSLDATLQEAGLAGSQVVMRWTS
jgi:hypothetical protein